MSENNPIYVTEPYLPPLDEFIPYLERIWESKQLTNSGPFHKHLEEALCDYLGVKYISLFTNGTLALVTALQALEVSGEVITTPYSFVATSHSLIWNGVKPVFADIAPKSFNLDPNKIEAAITPHTTAILPVHVYGNPCDVDAIDALAKKYNLKVIYDAAHAFGVKDGKGSVLNYGDLSILSFHATKVFNTFEGGAIICHDEKTKQHIDHLKNFGFVNEETVVAPGINSKMNELQAAIGLLQLEHIDDVLEKRKEIDFLYRNTLRNIQGIECIDYHRDIVPNYSYFPILVNSDYPNSRDELYEKFKCNGVFPRRYFYPLISHFPSYKKLASSAPENLPISEEVAKKIICLPIHPNMDAKQVTKILNVISN